MEQRYVREWCGRGEKKTAAGECCAYITQNRGKKKRQTVGQSDGSLTRKPKEMSTGRAF